MPVTCTSVFSLRSKCLRGTSTLNSPDSLFRQWSKVPPPPPFSLSRSDDPGKVISRALNSANCLVRCRSRRNAVESGTIYHVAIQARAVCMCARVGLTLWCCMMAVAFRLADIFSSPGCPLCPPSRSGKYLPRRSLSDCPPLSSRLLLSLCPSLFRLFFPPTGKP